MSAFGPAEHTRQRLGALIMALALIFAAFLGGALGLVWQSASLELAAEELDELPKPPVSG